jgi:hypothetical protein
MLGCDDLVWLWCSIFGLPSPKQTFKLPHNTAFARLRARTKGAVTFLYGSEPCWGVGALALGGRAALAGGGGCGVGRNRSLGLEATMSSVYGRGRTGERAIVGGGRGGRHSEAIQVC